MASSSETAAYDLNISVRDCGCRFDWRVVRWTVMCLTHANQDRPEGCVCLIVGQDDGAQTCFMHHDCSLGYCTHQDIDDDRESYYDED